MTETFAIDEMTEQDEAPAAGANRRKHARRRAYWSVKCQMLSGKWLKAKTDDVSAGGMQLVADIAFKSGTQLFIKMPLVYRNFQREIEAIVETRYVVASNEGFRVGMMFKRISDADREFLRAYAEKEI